MFADTALAHRIETRQAADDAAKAEALRHSYPASAVQVLSLMGGSAIRTGSIFPVNRGVGMGVSGPVTEAELEQMEAFYAESGLPAEIEVCPLVDPSLVKLLAQREYTLARFYNAYARSLQLDATFPVSSPDIHVRQAEVSERDLWARTVAISESDNDPIAIFAQAIFTAPQITCFIAEIGGEVAGGAALSIEHNIAAFSFMGTAPAFRRRGVQQALLAARLAFAAAQGCDLALCHTNPGNQSQRNVQRLGFSLLYTKVIMRRTPVRSIQT
jgi:GNAT superfamily N-acetyltransferase